MNRTSSGGGQIVLPKTLEEARRLVAPSPSEEVADRAEDRLLSIIGGRKQPTRERSIDSFRSIGSNPSLKRSAVIAAGRDPLKDVGDKEASNPPLGSTPPNAAAAFESMKNFGNTLNPLNHMPVWRGFGKSNSPSPTSPSIAPASAPTSALSDKSKSTGAQSQAQMTSRQPPQPASAPTTTSTMTLASLPSGSLTPPVSKFVGAESINDLKMGDMPELLAEYQRLVSQLNELGAWKEA